MLWPRKKPRNPIRDSLINALGLIVIHWILAYILADRNVVSALLSPSQGSSLFTVFIAVVYVLIRVLTILFVPAILIRLLWLLIAENWLVKDAR